MAVRVGFEPTEPVKVQRFSRPPDSTTLAPHRIFIIRFPNHLGQVSPFGKTRSIGQHHGNAICCIQNAHDIDGRISATQDRAHAAQSPRQWIAFLSHTTRTAESAAKPRSEIAPWSIWIPILLTYDFGRVPA